MFKEVADYYDLVMADFDYRDLVDYLDDLIVLSGGKRTDVLDLGCGTAEELVYFMQLGYKISGLDMSSDMLRRAKQKLPFANFYNEDMTNFKLDVKFDNVISTFDSVNYITDEKKLFDMFKCSYDVLNTGGYFLFDFNTAYGIINEWNGVKFEEGDGYKMVYESEIDYDKMITDTKIHFFIKEENETYRHFHEIHREKGYTKERISELLVEAGFKVLKIVPFLKKGKTKDTKIDRYQVVCKKV